MAVYRDVFINRACKRKIVSFYALRQKMLPPLFACESLVDFFQSPQIFRLFVFPSIGRPLLRKTGLPLRKAVTAKSSPEQQRRFSTSSFGGEGVSQLV